MLVNEFEDAKPEKITNDYTKRVNIEAKIGSVTHRKVSVLPNAPGTAAAFTLLDPFSKLIEWKFKKL